MNKKSPAQQATIAALILVLMSTQALAMQPSGAQRKSKQNKNSSAPTIQADAPLQTLDKQKTAASSPQIIKSVSMAYAVAAGAPKEKETEDTAPETALPESNKPSQSTLGQERDLQEITAEDVLEAKQKLPIETKQLRTDSPTPIKTEKKELPYQYERGELTAEIEKMGTWFRTSSRRVREKALELVEYNPETHRLGTCDPLENASLFATAVTSWKYHRTPEDIQQCMHFLDTCREKNIALDKTTCEAARDFLNEIRTSWEKETKTQLTTAEQKAQTELIKQIEQVEKIYEQQQKTLGELLTKKHASLLEIRTAIAAAAKLCNGAKISDKAPQIMEYTNKPALLKHLGFTQPQIIPENQVRKLKDLADHPLLMAPEPKK